MSETTVLIPGGYARAFPVKAGQLLKVVDVEGNQVADMIAFMADNYEEFLSPTHTRTMLGRVRLQVGDKLTTNYRNPVLEVLEDTVGKHDLLFAACDPKRYELDYGIKEHRSCRQNFTEVLEPYNIGYWRIPDPVNLFQNTPVLPDGRLAEPSPSGSKPGDYILFRALADLLVAISACPQDQNALNNWKVTDIKAIIQG